MNLQIEKASSILEYSEIAFEIGSQWKERLGSPEIWFRGVGAAKYQLLAGA